MKTTVRFFYMIAICIAVVANAQPTEVKYSRIGIGDTVPGELPLINLVNYSKANAHISDFKGKWLILDYWFTGCAPCIESWPKLTELQRKYNDKIQIVLVNHMQNRAVVENFINKRNKVNKEKLLLPSVTGDTVLFKILPPFGYPSVVWINPDGIYKASTEGAEFNAQNIELALNSGNVKNLVKNTSFINLLRPLFIDENGGTGQQMLFYSVISKYSDKVRDGLFLLSADSSGYVVAATHKPILDLIMRAYCKGPFPHELVDHIRLPRTHIELRVSDPTRFLSAVNGVRSINNLYTYQLISYEPCTIGQLQAIMRDDIERYFRLEMRWEKKKKKCLVLNAQDTTLLSDGLPGKVVYGFKSNGNQFLRNVTIDNFFGYLTEYIGSVYSAFEGYPLINETGFTGGLDLVFDNITDQNYAEVFSDYNKLNAALAKYKMHLSLEEREVDILVVSDASE